MIHYIFDRDIELHPRVFFTRNYLFLHPLPHVLRSNQISNLCMNDDTSQCHITLHSDTARHASIPSPIVYESFLSFYRLRLRNTGSLQTLKFYTDTNKLIAL